MSRGPAVLAVLAGALLARRARRAPRVARAVIADPAPGTRIDGRGAVESVQRASLTLPAAALERIWTPMHLERLARTYWRFITRATLGLVRVHYTATTRSVVLLLPALRLLRFRAPEYRMDRHRGVVRWRIEDGVLVARDGRGEGWLQIDARREPADAGCEVLHVDVAVANFYPTIALRISRRIYLATQSRIHVVVTHGFLRSLARLDLARSRAGRLEGVAAVPPPAADSDGHGPFGDGG